MSLQQATIVMLSTLLLLACDGSGSAEQPRQQPAIRVLDDGAVALTTAARAFIDTEQLAADTTAALIDVAGRLDFRDQGVVSVISPVEARISALEVAVGEPVVQGQPLIALQGAAIAGLRADYARANLQVQAASTEFERQQRMIERGIGVETERFEAEIALADAEQALAAIVPALMVLDETDGEALDQALIRAPESGVVLQMHGSLGQQVEAGGVLLELGDPQSVWAIAEVLERDLWLLSEGMEAKVQLQSLPQPIAGSVSRIPPTVDAITRRASVIVNLETDLTLVPGSFARVSFLADGLDMITLPPTAVLIRDGMHHTVYVEREPGVFEARQVQLGARVSGRIQITEGLMPGETVVVRGALLLDGSADQLL